MVSKYFSAFVIKQNCLNKQSTVLTTIRYPVDFSCLSFSLEFQHLCSRLLLFSFYTNDLKKGIFIGIFAVQHA